MLSDVTFFVPWRIVLILKRCACVLASSQGYGCPQIWITLKYAQPKLLQAQNKNDASTNLHNAASINKSARVLLLLRVENMVSHAHTHMCRAMFLRNTQSACTRRATKKQQPSHTYVGWICDGGGEWEHVWCNMHRCGRLPQRLAALKANMQNRGSSSSRETESRRTTRAERWIYLPHTGRGKGA